MLSPEQKELSRDDDLSFRRQVGRGARAPHAQAMAWLDRCLDLGALESVESVVVVHRLDRGSFSATGFLADMSLAAYGAGQVKGHEATIPKTQDKMLEYMQSTGIFGNPVALGHRDQSQLALLLASHSTRTADVVFETVEATQHSLWLLTGDDAIAVCDKVGDTLYVTDGHHRLAAASELARQEDTADRYIPAAVYAEQELRLRAYARAINDQELSATEVLGSIAAVFQLEEVGAEVPRPAQPQQIGMRMCGRSFLLTIPVDLVPTDVYDKLDVNLLQHHVLGPHFGIANPRTDQRLRFIADTPAADHDVDSHTAWFLPHAAVVPDVMAVADSGRSMPPKSTFFLPKVPSGLVIRRVVET